MSGTDDTCGYKFKSDTPETWGGQEGEECYVEPELLDEEGSWSCPRDARGGNDYCIFHEDITKKDHEKVIESLSNEIVAASREDRDSEQRRAAEFIGAKFEQIELKPGQVVQPRIHLEHAHVRDGIDAEHVSFKNGISAKGLTIGESDQESKPSTLDKEREKSLVESIGLDYHDEFPTEDTQSERDVSFCQSHFGGPVEFDGANFSGSGHLSFAHAEFEGDGRVSFEESKFTNRGHVAFNMVDFENQGDVSFEEAVFSNGDVSFSVADFTNDGDVWFDEVKFCEGGNVTFCDTDFLNPAIASFDEVTLDIDLQSDRNEDYALEFTDAKFIEDVEIGVTGENDEIVSFINADFSEANLTIESLPIVDFRMANLNQVDLSDLDLSGANLKKANLNQAMLLNTSLSGAHLAGAAFGNSQVNEGTFEALKLDNSSYREGGTWKRLRSWVVGPVGDDAYRCVDDPKCDYPESDWKGADSIEGINNDNRDDPAVRAGGVYRQFELLASDNALPEWQRRFFILRQNMQTQQKSGVDWCLSKIQQTLFGYGESFGRVVGWSAGFILSFALFYLAGGWIYSVGPDGQRGAPIAFSRIPDDPMVLWDSLYYSTLTFTALGFGDFRPGSAAGQLLTVLETTIGALLLALLIFVVGRKAAR